MIFDKDHNGPRIGQMIRAYRLGWGYSKPHGAFVRISDERDGFRVELCPVHALPLKKLKGNHRCWWEDADVLAMIPWLQWVRRVKRYVCVIMDEQGAILRSESNGD